MNLEEINSKDDMQIKVIESSKSYFFKNTLDNLKIGSIVKCRTKKINSIDFRLDHKYKVIDLVTDLKIPVIRSDNMVLTPVWSDYFEKLENSIAFIKED